MDLLSVQRLIDKFDFEQTVRIHELLNKHPHLKDKDTRIDIMTYQFGEFVKFFKIYSRVYKVLNDGYKAEARLSLANLLIQIEMFCISNKWDINVLRNEGYEHLLDKIEEVEAKGGNYITKEVGLNEGKIMSDDIIKIGVGVCLGYVISKISKKNVTNFINSAIIYYNKKDMDKRIEKRKVVDVMGDHIGYLNCKNEIVKNVTNEVVT